MQADSREDSQQAVPESDASMEPWMYEQVKYARYWQHYKEMQRWMSDYMSSWKHNSQVQIGSANAMPNQHINRSRFPHGYDPYHWPPRHQYHPQATPHNEKKNRQHRKKHAQNSNQKSRPQRGAHNADVAMEEHTDDGDHYELEVSEEMKAFFAQSEEFRRKRDNAKEKGESLKWPSGDKIGKGSKVDDSQTNADEIVLSSSESEGRLEDTSSHQMETDTPKERPGVRRIVEMKELYGRHAAAIHGMETAMQLQFDRHYDRKKPALWPIVPLKM